jgi:hypothetical protein
MAKVTTEREEIANILALGDNAVLRANMEKEEEEDAIVFYSEDTKDKVQILFTEDGIDIQYEGNLTDCAHMFLDLVVDTFDNNYAFIELDDED